MKDRIKQIQNITQMSQQDFAKAIGVAPGSLSSVYSERTQPTSNYVLGIHKAFPDININWLMFGEGEMYVNKDSSPSDPPLPHVGDGAEGSLSLFDQTAPSPSEVLPFAGQGVPVSRSTEMGSLSPAMQMGVPVAAKEFDNKKREVKEIRVFFSDGTYESFLPSK